MKSPFPGMDPYLEQHWEDVHARLISYIADELQPQLSDDLFARMEEKVYVQEESDVQGIRKPDVRIAERPVFWSPSPGDVSTAVVDRPILLKPIVDPIRERSVLIHDAGGNRIVTAIELLSPWNKAPGGAVNEYLEKRSKYLRSEINLVEIDLIRTGNWLRMIGEYQVPKNSLTAYRVTVTRADQEGLLLYPVAIRNSLPSIEVPLRSNENPAKLNLQHLIEKVYKMGRYDHIDYSKAVSPPLSDEDAAWAIQLIDQRNASRR